MATIVDPYNFQPVRPHRAAEGGRRMHGTFATARSANAVSIQDGERLARIVHDQTRNFPLVESFLSGWVAHTVGTGIWPDFAVESETLRKWFRKWMRQADADGRTTLHGLSALIARKVAQDGEVFARFRFRRPDDGLDTPLQIQLICSAQLPRDKTTGGQGGNSVVAGIERDAIGRRVAYHFYREHPGDVSVTNRMVTNEKVRVPANQILHIGLPSEPGELRQVSILRSALLTLKSISDTNENTMERLRVLSLFTALFSEPLGEHEPPRFAGADAPDQAGTAKSYNLEPGMLNEVPEGGTVWQLETPDVGSTYMDFMRSQMQNVAAMLGLVYPELSGDFNNITLSSLRAGIVAARRRHTFFTRHCLVDQWLVPVMRMAIETAVLSGAVTLPGYAADPDEFNRILWRGQKEEYIDPAKDSVAEKNALDNLKISLSDIQDGDPDDVAERIAEDRARMTRLGISFETDPRQPQPVPTDGSEFDDPREDE